MADTKKSRAAKAKTREDTPEPGDGEQDTVQVRMANANHGASFPGDVVEVPAEEAAAITQAWEGQPVAGDDGDQDDGDERPRRRRR